MLVAQNVSLMVMPRFSVVAAKLDALERKLHTVVAEVPYGTQMTEEETVAPTVEDPQSESEIDNVRGSDSEHGTVEQGQGEDTLSVLEDLQHFADQVMEGDAGDFSMEEDSLLKDDVVDLTD